MVNPDGFIDLSVPGTFSPDIVEYTQTGTQPTPTIGPAPIDPASLWNAVSGNPVERVLNFLNLVLGDLESAISQVDLTQLGGIFSALGTFVNDIVNVFDIQQLSTWENIVKYAPTSGFYREMLTGGLGIDMSKFSSSGLKGVETVDQMLSFAIIMQYVGAAADIITKLPLGARIGPGIVKAIQQIPEDMGLSWALGMQIDSAFSTAVGEIINEEIRYQKRPSRIEWKVLKALFKQHKLDKDTLIDLLAHQGFEHRFIKMIMELDEVQLPIGDIQALYQAGDIDAAGVRTYIAGLGFSDADVDKLVTLYIDKANTASGAQLRNVARALAANQIITMDVYRGYLERTNFPAMEIAFDIEAIQLEIDKGRTHTSTSVIKSMFLHNRIAADAAITKLREIGLTPDAAQELVASWQLPHISPQRGLSESQILSYMMSNLLTNTDAYNRLISIGVTPSDAQFLVNNPTSKLGVRVHPRTPSLVIQAYLDGAITIDQLDPMLKSAGVADVDMTMYHQIATYRYAHRKHSTGPTVPLSKGEILDAFALGLHDLQTTINALVNLGYSSEDALLLVDIKNKGPIQTPPAPLFTDIGSAISYLDGAGYHVYAPPDPHINAAMMLVEQYGFLVTPPNPMPAPTEVGGLIGSGQIAGIPTLAGGINSAPNTSGGSWTPGTPIP